MGVIVIVATLVLEGPWGLFAIGEGLGGPRCLSMPAVEQLQRLVRR